MEGVPAMTGLHKDAFGTSQSVTVDVFKATNRVSGWVQTPFDGWRRLYINGM
jgi:hypothetical protein